MFILKAFWGDCFVIWVDASIIICLRSLFAHHENENQVSSEAGQHINSSCFGSPSLPFSHLQVFIGFKPFTIYMQGKFCSLLGLLFTNIHLFHTIFTTCLLAENIDIYYLHLLAENNDIVWEHI